MMARLVALAAVGVVTGGAQYSCSGGSGLDVRPPRDIDSGDGPTFTTTLRLKDSAGTERATFTRGELITFELTVRNRTAEPVTVDLSTTQDTNFFVFRNGANTPIWNAAHGMAFATVITPLTFGANESKVLTATWNQEIPDGTFLPRGNYEARGAIMGVGVLPTYLAEHELASTLEAFSVK
ncbi:MAG TPA: BsuPI-related putative proteinase inhibitor [Steroidobacteraceae bacterium]